MSETWPGIMMASFAVLALILVVVNHQQVSYREAHATPTPTRVTTPTAVPTISNTITITVTPSP